MHEMSLAESVLQLVEDVAQREKATQIKTVILEIGALASIEMRSFCFCFEAVKQGTIAAEATLEIHEIPGEGWCMPCGKHVPLASLGSTCPCCGSGQVQPVRGTEMRVKEIEI